LLWVIIKKFLYRIQNKIRGGIRVNSSRLEQDVNKSLAKSLIALQNEMIEKKVSMMIVFEGIDEIMKGKLINRLIKPLDQRWLNVYCVNDFAETYSQSPYLKKFWLMTPSVGKISIMDQVWFKDHLLKAETNDELNSIFQRMNRFEQQLKSEGVILIKFILDRQTGSSTLIQLLTNETTQNEGSQWVLLDEISQNLNETKMLETVKQCLEAKLHETEKIATKQREHVYEPKFSFQNIDLIPKLDSEIFELRLNDYHKRIQELSEKLKIEKKSLILLFEGWDGAGKSGSIGSVISPLDPRKYRVVPHATIKDFEPGKHYLYYYWNLIPKFGDILIMDRTWYKWVMENRIYKKCSVEKWRKAYNHITEMEKEFADSGVVILKFWLHIDKEEQLKRFNHRLQNDHTLKANQLEDDWRNREHWEEFEKCAEEMIDRTSKSYSPWIVVPSICRNYAKDKIFSSIFNAVENTAPENNLSSGSAL
jgi:AMP-polyphosphate phosphotransferase